jgi:DivIVA domain-containing protein
MTTPHGLDALGYEATERFAAAGSGGDDGSYPQFATVMRGYDRGQVDDYVARLNDFLADAEQRAQRAEGGVADLTTRVERLTEELRHAVERRQPNRAGAPYDGLGERIEQVLRLAGEEADNMREHAQSEADAILTDAQRRREAEREASERDLAAVATRRDAVVAELRRVQDVLATLGLRQALVDDAAATAQPDAAAPDAVAPEVDPDATRVIQLPTAAVSQ